MYSISGVRYLMVLVHVTFVIKMVYKISNILYETFYILNAFAICNQIYMKGKAKISSTEHL